jgi:hypothetical protein
MSTARDSPPARTHSYHSPQSTNPSTTPGQHCAASYLHLRQNPQRLPRGLVPSDFRKIWRNVRSGAGRFAGHCIAAATQHSCRTPYLLPPRSWSRGLRSGWSVLVFRGEFRCCGPPGFFFRVLGCCRNSGARKILFPHRDVRPSMPLRPPPGLPSRRH